MPNESSGYFVGTLKKYPKADTVRAYSLQGTCLEMYEIIPFID